jgi:hypothetical protein
LTTADPGSFRDPLSRVYRADGRILRGLSAEGLADFEAVSANPFFAELEASGAIVGSTLLEPASHPLHEQWAGVLEHDPLATITYPFEWTFEMLRAAALAHLDVTRAAVRAGFTTKDASAYNVTFRGTQPVFFDIGSFERSRRSEPWPGYRQFCDHFLNPLVLQAASGIDFQPWLRGSLDGLSGPDVASAVALRKRIFKGLLVHLTLHARAQRRYADADAERDVKADLRQAGFSPKLVLAQLDSLEKAVRALRWRSQGSEWSDYADRAHYQGTDLAEKERFVAEAVGAISPELVVDLGANDGRFSLLALEHGATSVVAPDADHLVVDQLYRRLQQLGERRVTPLVIDLANPSPPMGWRSQERAAFTSRVRPDLVLCLAVVHHLALTNTAPFEHIVDLLADFDAPLVVEFPHPDDPMAARLLARKRAGEFDHYRLDRWEEALRRRFEVETTQTLATRTLYRCRPSQAG